MQTKWTSILLLVLMGATWGLQVAMLKLALGASYNEQQVILYTLVLVGVAYFVLLVIRKGLFRFDKTNIVFFVVTSILGYLIPMGATLVAARALPAGLLAFLVSMSPLFTFATAIILKTEKVSGFRLGALVFGSLAAIMVAWPEFRLPGYGALPWMAVGLLIPFCYGIESIYIDKFWPENLDVFQIGFGEVVFAIIILLPFMLFGDSPIFVPIDWNVSTLAVLIFAVCGLFEVVMYFHLIQTTGGVLVSFATFVSLFAGIGWGILIFNESHSSWIWIAF